jgi:hypothetical protein
MRLTQSPCRPEKRFDIACDDLHIAQRFVVYPGGERFELRHGAQAIGLHELIGLLGQ